MSGTFETLKLHGELKYWKDQNGMNIMPSGLKAELHPWFKLVSEITAKSATSFSFDQLQQLHGFSSFFAEGAPSTGLRLGVEDEYRKKLLPLIETALQDHPHYRAYRIVRDFYNIHVPQLRACIGYLETFEAISPKAAQNVIDVRNFISAIEGLDPHLADYLQKGGDPASQPAFTPVASQIFSGIKGSQLRDTEPMSAMAQILKHLYYALENSTPEKAPAVMFKPQKSVLEMYHDCDQVIREWESSMAMLNMISNAKTGRIAI